MASLPRKSRKTICLTTLRPFTELQGSSCRQCHGWECKRHFYEHGDTVVVAGFQLKFFVTKECICTKCSEVYKVMKYMETSYLTSDKTIGIT